MPYPLGHGAVERVVATSFATAVSVSRAACATAAGLNAPHAVRLVAQFVVCGVSAHESHAAAAAQHCGRSMPPRKCDMTVRAHGVVVSHPLCMRKALGSIPSVSTCGCVRGFVVVSLRRRCGAGASVWRKCKAPQNAGEQVALLPRGRVAVARARRPPPL